MGVDETDVRGTAPAGQPRAGPDASCAASASSAARQGGVVLIGPGHGADTLRLQRFLTRSAYPHRSRDTEEAPSAGGFLNGFELTANDLPVVIAPGNKVVRNLSTAQLADDLGLTEAIDAAHVFDVAIVGAGPAGLAVAVYAASSLL